MINDSGKTPAKILTTPAQYLSGVGANRASLLRKLNIETIADVLFFFPRDYQDFSDVRTIDQLEEDKLQTIQGTVEKIDLRPTRKSGSLLKISIWSQEQHIEAIWFNQAFMRARFSVGQRVLVSGKPKLQGSTWQVTHPRIETLTEDEQQAKPSGGILPVYSLTEGIQQWQIRRIVRNALEKYTDLLEDVFPVEYLESHDLIPILDALPQIHFPSDSQTLEKARRRFVYQELFILQLALVVKRSQMHAQQLAPLLEATNKIDARICQLFPFDLTSGQRDAIKEISSDMNSRLPMNRLLQGDVGSGKTVVAVYAMLLAVAHGYQAVMMAPTEVLSRQHSLTLKKLLHGSKVNHLLLTGGLATGPRRKMLERIASGETDIVVGTHALLQKDVQFKKLGLAVIDEQHKFGVRQRAILKQAGIEPHYLVMTATPIPRTVTMTLFGDLEISTLRDSPPGRQKVHTYLSDNSNREKWWEFVRKKLLEGRQAYIVVPMIDESKLEIANLKETYESLANGQLEAFRLGLVHGRMTAEEKDAVMDDFRRGEIQALMCTSVVEVGVDVQNATVMTIEAAERFGLAQLHQLRGRISRGRHPGFCCLFANSKTKESRQRLDSLASTTDGFKLAEIDFKIRGPGELFGTRQHGIPPFRIADLMRDQSTLEESRRDAKSLVAADPGLADDSHRLLRRMMLSRYGKALDLGDVG